MQVPKPAGKFYYELLKSIFIVVEIIRISSDHAIFHCTCQTYKSILEAEIYDSSQDADFESKLISPREIHKLHGRVHEEDDITINTPLRTPTKTEKRKSNSANTHSLSLNTYASKQIF